MFSLVASGRGKVQLIIVECRPGKVEWGDVLLVWLCYICNGKVRQIPESRLSMQSLIKWR